MGRRTEKYLENLTFSERQIFANNIEHMFCDPTYASERILLGIFYYLIAGIGEVGDVARDFLMPLGFFTAIPDEEIFVDTELLEKGIDRNSFFSIGFKFVHDFVSSKSENAELANKTVHKLVDVFNETAATGFPYTKHIRDSILTEWRKITIEFLRKAVGLEE